ncbi:M48 family metallopeptidase [Dyella tabacisoli]|uniref:Zn-dependent protease with chaperone function n=1 Tax=Dyella tabacisoli TaxID=2282381 RepID=A0A369UGE6_9GAMM|nr:M48 family metallopeptidase [Dyella tabacisoli]RDD79802.1 Zn-dependent protease with chaperone function [Dyella tabacisoli]
METMYPTGPTEVPAAFTRPGPSYRRHAWLAVGGLLLFMLLYFALTAWFVMTGLGELMKLNSDGGFAQVAVGVGSLFLAFFMIKALFFIKKGGRNDGIELTRAEQPRLFAFLERIADEAGAPRPHKVYVTGRVNAAVFYDLSLLNLLFPSRKNLEIGLGLVNMLNLGEFKAVCAHEFGHFAQRSMAVGRWVYTTQQIAAHIVGRRDALDTFLRQLSRMDLRIAWVGWLLGLVIWALRAVVDVTFRLVVIAQRALSREMEMQADLVAVSLTGSDALVLALHRLQVVDDAWDRTMIFLRGEVANQRPPRDVFAVHQALAERLRLIYNDPDYGNRLQVPGEGAAAFRVFNSELAQPPRMWSTHPMNHERETNAKRIYLFAPADERSAWEVFDDSLDLRERMTRELAGKTEHAIAEPAETLKKLDEQFGREHLKPHYRGIYLGFSAVRQSARVEDLHERALITGPLHLEMLYPENIGDELGQLRSLETEHALLCSLRDRIYDAPDGVIRHRGRILKRSELPAAIAAVDVERAATRAGLETTLKRVRSLHLAAAAKLSPTWQEYLQGLLQLLHYADHSEANVRDAHAGLARTWQHATARGSINERGVRHILASANDVHRALTQVFSLASSVRPGAKILAELGEESWPALLGGYGLNAPVRANINEWLRLIDRWVNHTAGCLSALRRATLDELLLTETTVAAATHGTPAPVAPDLAPTIPDTYHTLAPGSERGRHEKLDFWHKFQTATGFFPGLARAVVAIAIVGSVLAVGWIVGRTTVTVYNGLARAVVATVDGHRVALAPHAHADVSVASRGDIHVTTLADDGELIEDFTAPVSQSDTQLVYTVAAASPLRQWTAVYGNWTAAPPHMLAPKRWQAVSAENMFTTPPDRIQSKSGGGTRTVLDAGDDDAPEYLVNQLQDKHAAEGMLLAHVRFDKPDSPHLLSWLGLAASVPGFDTAFAARRAHFPVEIVAMRAEQDLAKGPAHDVVCSRQRALADASPTQSDLAYLVTRCMPSGPARDQKFAEGYKRWPDSPWFANAAASMEGEHANYQAAFAAYQVAMSKSLVLRPGAALQALRLLRLLNPAAARQQQGDFARASPAVSNILLAEPGAAVPNGPGRSLVMLSNGQLDDAVTAAANTPMAGHVLRLAASSQGASTALRARAARLPPSEGIDEQTVWLAIAEGEDAGSPAIAAVLENIEKEYDTPGAVAKVQRFLALSRSGNAVAAEQALDGVPFLLRAQAYIAGSHLLGDRAPPNWRIYARGILFAVERPYLG